MTNTTKSRTFKVTYLGVPATVREVTISGGASGTREVRILWHGESKGQDLVVPAGTVTSRTIKGNFLKGTGQVLVATHVATEQVL